jgi:hypothetical protein
LTTHALSGPLYGGEREVGWACPEPERVRVIVRCEAVRPPWFTRVIPSPPWKYMPGYAMWGKKSYSWDQPPLKAYHTPPVRYYRPKQDWTYTPKEDWTYHPKVFRSWP